MLSHGELGNMLCICVKDLERKARCRAKRCVAERRCVLHMSRPGFHATHNHPKVSCPLSTCPMPQRGAGALP